MGQPLRPAEMTVSVKTEYLAPAEPSMPGMVVEVIELVDSYMIWVGVAESPETVETASLRGRLCKDWAYAMPPREVRVERVRWGECVADGWMCRARRWGQAHGSSDQKTRMLGYRWRGDSVSRSAGGWTGLRQGSETAGQGDHGVY
jgi:hypothetical protein